ncbi:MAG TPA: TIGR03000 domain-containing protein [Fimbriiglobus sp.]|nr:TIGR03000 domain-containing protein [Fimbriiglobus sp.]
MYSLLLMTAVAGGPDAAAFGWRSGGCNGCYGGVAVGCSGYSSCYGGGFAGCSGSSCSGYSCSGYSSCHGCHGGGFLGCGLFARWHARKASCHGGSGYSCYGSLCHGYSAGWGSCYGSGNGGGCWGSCYGSGVGAGCWGSSYGAGCHGGAACYGAPVGPVMMDAIPVAPAAPAPAAPATGGTTSQAPARLTVELPATAKLFVDGAEVTGVGATRQFHTPDLPAAGMFFYDLRAEVAVNGTVRTEQKRVVVRAGETATATFAELAAAVGETGTVAVK